MATELITITRKEVADTIKAFDLDTRKAIDEALALGNDFARAHNDEAKRVNVARAIAVYRIASDAEAVKKTGFKTFKEVAAALFGLAPANATNYRKAAEQFYCNDKAPACKDWWGPSTLYLFCAAGIDNETIAAAISAGKLSEKSTNEQIKVWIASLEAEALEDGKPEVAKLYDGVFRVFHYTDDTALGLDTAPFYGLTMDEIKARLHPDESPAADEYFTAFNPHASITRINKKGAAKEITGKGIIYAALGIFSQAVYFPAEVQKTAQKSKNGPTEDTIAAQNATIEKQAADNAKLRAALIAAGIDPDNIQ